MKYTRQQRADIANAFKAAKPLLNDGLGNGNGGNYICNALRDSRANGWKEAKKIVSTRIAPDVTLRNWLDTQGIKDVPNDGRLKVQAHRHAWLDQLIEEFSV